jgi:plastocyanin domain-containing protein
VRFALALALVAGCAGRVGEQRVRIAVTEQGFVPAVATVRAGRPVTLLVTRRTDRTCATEFVLKAHGIDEQLPLGRTVAIRFTPERADTLGYGCAMGMIEGRIVVR